MAEQYGTQVNDKSAGIAAKVRYKHKPSAAGLYITQEKNKADSTVKLIFDEPQRAITKGQAVVVYDGDRVVGGGTIC